MDLQYRLLKFIFRLFGTNYFYHVNLPNKRQVDYSNREDVLAGNESSFVFYKHARVFLEWFRGNVEDRDFEGKHILDLGSGFGGRTVHYARAGTPALCVGIDVDQRGVMESMKFAQHVGQDNCAFTIGVGEHLPFREGSFDYILSYDVLEHVEDFEAVMDEVYRVLKKGGRLLAVFPPYYGPMGHHIKRTNLPWMNVVFSTRKTYEVLQKEYGDSFELWQRKGLTLRKGLNGVTIKEYRQYVRKSNFRVIQEWFAALLSEPTEIYKNIRSRNLKNSLRFLFSFTPKVPFMKEYLTHRIVIILEK